MDWVDRRLHDRSDFEKRRNALRAGAGVLWEELHRVCSQSVRRYNEHAQRNALPLIRAKPKLQTRFEFASVEYENGQEKEIAAVAVSLDLERFAIFLGSAAATRSTTPTFTVELDENGGPVLKHEGRVVNFEEAAERILDPVLFSDLPQVFSASSKS